jgi:hypothetical protein
LAFLKKCAQLWLPILAVREFIADFPKLFFNGGFFSQKNSSNSQICDRLTGTLFKILPEFNLQTNFSIKISPAKIKISRVAKTGYFSKTFPG